MPGGWGEDVSSEAKLGKDFLLTMDTARCHFTVSNAQVLLVLKFYRSDRRRLDLPIPYVTVVVTGEMVGNDQTDRKKMRLA